MRGTSGPAHGGARGPVTDRGLAIALRKMMCGPPRGSRGLVLAPLPFTFPIPDPLDGLAAGVAAIAGRCTIGRTPRLETARPVAKIVEIFLAA